MKHRRVWQLATLLMFVFAIAAFSSSANSNASYTNTTAAERGLYNLTHKPYGQTLLNKFIMDNVWKVWEPEWKARIKPNDPESMRKLVLERYGLSEAPYENGGAPMQFVSTNTGWAQTCMLCHGGRVPGTGQSMVGMPNTELDMQTLYEDVTSLVKFKGPIDMKFAMTRGRTNAFVFSIELLRRRNEDLSTRTQPLPMGDFKDCDLDPIPWWHFKKKTALYVDASIGGDFARPIMQFTMGEPNGEKIRSWEPDFKDVVEYLKTVEPPKYPWPVDQKLAASGKQVFERNCARCHGTYGSNGKYPNKLVPIAEVGTDSLRLTGITQEFREYFSKTWFAANSTKVHEKTTGYVAPPLDGVWASAPYFHNGSVPTVYGVLTKEARPKYFRRVGTIMDYDSRDLGLKIESMPAPPAADVPGEARRRVVDTTLPGLGNQGHPFGFHLTEKEKRQVIEYLKTL